MVVVVTVVVISVMPSKTVGRYLKHLSDDHSFAVGNVDVGADLNVEMRHLALVE